MRSIAAQTGSSAAAYPSTSQDDCSRLIGTQNLAQRVLLLLVATGLQLCGELPLLVLLRVQLVRG